MEEKEGKKKKTENLATILTRLMEIYNIIPTTRILYENSYTAKDLLRGLLPICARARSLVDNISAIILHYTVCAPICAVYIVH